MALFWRWFFLVVGGLLISGVLWALAGAFGVVAAAFERTATIGSRGLAILQPRWSRMPWKRQVMFTVLPLFGILVTIGLRAGWDIAGIGVICLVIIIAGLGLNLSRRIQERSKPQ